MIEKVSKTAVLAREPQNPFTEKFLFTFHWGFIKCVRGFADFNNCRN